MMKYKSSRILFYTLPIVLIILAMISVFSLSGCFEVYPRTADMEQEPPPEQQFNEQHPGEEPPPPEQHSEEFANEDHHPEEPPPPEPDPDQQQQTQPTQQQTQPTQQQNQQNQGKNWTTDVALTDIYPGSQPYGQFHVNITNHGPGTLNNVSVRINIGGTYIDRTKFLTKQLQLQTVSVTVILNMKPGDTQTFPTGLSLDLNTFMYDIFASVDCDFDDCNVKNNMMNEPFV